MSVKALFFDLDGTISNTHAIHLANWLELLRPYGIDVDMDLYKEKLSGDRSTQEIVDDVLPDLSEDEKKDLIEREESGYRSRMTQTGPITGLGDFIGEAKSRGISVTLVSNAPKGDARNSLEGLGLRDAFEPMIFAEDVGVEKPDPAPYQEALEELGISPEEVLAFEDSPSGVEGAVAAGIPVVGLSSTHAPNELREAGAEFIVGDFVDRALYKRIES